MKLVIGNDHAAIEMKNEIKEYLAGNLCRCSGYEGQLRGIQNFLAWKKAKEASEE